ncbi:hypothetical protein S40293_09126 [Stachybotrys chartarum IBT 40293]|nr:hypothetical protein S40293_09126 [Stachybotrys chartarum IBT 40293]
MMDSCETDQIFPIHAFDDSALNRSMVVTGLLRYSALLNASKLRDSLITLLHTGDWKKLRGRLRFNDDGNLYISVPPAAADRPALKYKHTNLGIPIAQHSSFSNIATSKPTSAIQPAIADSDNIATGLVPPDWPRSLAEFTNPQRDEPIIGLHIVSFSDTTLVVLMFSHILMDGAGIAAFLSAWSSVVAGAQKIMPLIGAREDPLDVFRLSKDYGAPFVLADQKVDGAALMPMSLSEDTQPPDADWDISLPGTRWRVISLSRAAASSLVQEACESMPTVNGSPPYVSEDDVVSAWFFRTIARTVAPTRAMNNYRVYDMRRRLPVFQSNAAYIQNAFGLIWTIGSSAGDIATASLGQLAVALRESLQQQTSQNQVVAAMRQRKDGISPLYGDPTGLFLMVNSWDRMKIYQNTDFSAALMANSIPSVGDRSNTARQPDVADFDFGLGSAPGPTVTWSGKDLGPFLHSAPCKPGREICLTGRRYTRRTGDTCESIARSNGVSAVALYMGNQNIMPDCSSVQPNVSICFPMTCDLHFIQPSDTCVSIDWSLGLGIGHLRRYNSWINSACTNLHSATDFYGKVICVSPQGGSFTGTAAPPQETSGPRDGYTRDVVEPPGTVPVAERTTLNCGRWHAVTVEDMCASICIRNGSIKGLFHDVNPSLAASDGCIESLQPGRALCVGPTYYWNTTMPTATTIA